MAKGDSNSDLCRVNAITLSPAVSHGTICPGQQVFWSSAVNHVQARNVEWMLDAWLAPRLEVLSDLGPSDYALLTLDRAQILENPPELVSGEDQAIALIG